MIKVTFETAAKTNKQTIIDGVNTTIFTTTLYLFSEKKKILLPSLSTYKSNFEWIFTVISIGDPNYLDTNCIPFYLN